jgi:hypothetical protein
MKNEIQTQMQELQPEGGKRKNQMYDAVLKSEVNYQTKRREFFLEIKLTEQYTKQQAIKMDAAGLLQSTGRTSLTGKLVSGNNRTNGRAWKAIDFMFHDSLRERVFLSDYEALMVGEPEPVKLNE